MLKLKPRPFPLTIQSDLCRSAVDGHGLPVHLLTWVDSRNRNRVRLKDVGIIGDVSTDKDQLAFPMITMYAGLTR